MRCRSSLPPGWRGLGRTAALLLLAGGLFFAAPAAAAPAEPGTLCVLQPSANLRAGPHLSSPVVARLTLNQTLVALGRAGEWRNVATLSGQAGWVRGDLVSGLWLRVLLAEGRVALMSGRLVLETFPAIVGPAPLPEGRYYVCETQAGPLAGRALLLSHPGVDEARRALAANRIDRRTYLSIVSAVRGGRLPEQGTILGGGARITGGRLRTAPRPGMILLDDAGIKALLARLPRHARVDVHRTSRQAAEAEDQARLGAAVALGAAEQLKTPAAFLRPEPGPFKLAYPGGDIQPDLACDADVVVRALRRAGLDLQALIHEDILFDHEPYSRLVKAPDPDFDHRRVEVLTVFLARRAENLPLDPRVDPFGFSPGDIVLLAAPNASLLGVLEHRLGRSGLPRVVTVIGPGRRVESQDLLGRLPVAGHFRLLPAFEYR